MSNSDRSTGKEVNENVERSYHNLFVEDPFKADGNEGEDIFNPQPVSWKFITNLKTKLDSLSKTLFALKKGKGDVTIGTLVVEVGHSTSFPKKVIPKGRKTPIEVKKDEVESVKPSELSVEDVFELILKPELDQDSRTLAKRSVTKILRSDEVGEPYSGAYVIVSRKMLMLDLYVVLSKYIAAIIEFSKSLSPEGKKAEKDFYFWLDIFSMPVDDSKQERSSLEFAGKNVPLFKEHLLVFDSHVSPTVLTRFWSIWEIYCLVKAEKKFRTLFYSKGSLEVEIDFIKSVLNEIPASLSLYPCFYVSDPPDNRHIQNDLEKSMNANSDRTDGDPDDDGFGGSFSTKDFSLFSFIDAIDVHNLDSTNSREEYRVRIGQLEGGFKGVKKVISRGIRQAIYSEFDGTFEILWKESSGLELVSITRRFAYFYKIVGKLQVGKEVLHKALWLVDEYNKLPKHDRLMSAQMGVLLSIDLAMFELSKDDDRHQSLSLEESSQPLNLEEVQKSIFEADRRTVLFSIEVLIRKILELAMQQREFQKFYVALCKEVDENEGSFKTQLVTELARIHLGLESDEFIKAAKPLLEEYDDPKKKHKNPDLQARLYLANAMSFKAKFNRAKGNPSTKESPDKLFQEYCGYLKSAISCWEEHNEDRASKHHFTAACYRLELGKFYFNDKKDWGRAEIEFQVAKENIEYHGGISDANKHSIMAEICYFLGEIRTKLGYFIEGEKYLDLALKSIKLFKYGSSDLEAATRLALATCMQGTNPEAAKGMRDAALSLLTDNHGNRSVLQVVPTSSPTKEIVIDAEI